MGLGLGHLRLPPNQFWAMTPKELEAAIDAVLGNAPQPLTRTGMDELIRQFPDEVNDG